MPTTPDLSRTVRFGLPIVAVLGAAYPTLFFWTAALDVGPYGSIRPIDWSRIATGWRALLPCAAVIGSVSGFV